MIGRSLKLPARWYWLLAVLATVSSLRLLVVSIPFVNEHFFVFQTPLHSLKEVYPNFYFLIFLITRSINISPILAAVSLVLIAKRPNRIGEFLLRNFQESKFYFKTEIVGFTLASLMSIVFYFIIIVFFEENINIQIFTTRAYLTIMMLYYLLIVWFKKKEALRFVRNFMFQSGSRLQLAILRIVFFTYLIYIYIGHMFKHQDIGLLPKEALPGIGWLIELTPVDYSIYRTVCLIGIWCSILIVVGFKTRYFLLINALCVFYIIATPNFFGKLWHHQLIIWITWILSASPCYHALSLDSFFKKGKMESPAWAYGFSIKVIWLHFGLIYFFAGFFKLWLCGFEWALGESMIN